MGQSDLTIGRRNNAIYKHFLMSVLNPGGARTKFDMLRERICLLRRRSPIEEVFFYRVRHMHAIVDRAIAQSKSKHHSYA